MAAPAPITAPPGPAADDDYFGPDDEQLAAFDEPAAPERNSSAPAPADDRGPVGEPPATRVSEASTSNAASTRPDIAADEPEVAPVPAFLVGRSGRPRPSPKLDDRVSREDVVPSWEIDGRFGAQAADRPGRAGVLNQILTIIAVLVILGLGVAAVILVPGLLNAPAGSTLRPSLVAPSLALSSASPLSSQVAVVPTATSIITTPSPTSSEPTAEPTPEASPILYRIKAGDTLAKIARKHDITTEELLAANPQITNPDHIEVGQIIVIPLPSTTPEP